MTDTQVPILPAPAPPHTPDEFARLMRGIFPESDGHDEEAAHCLADTLMLDLLRSLGYGAGADIFDTASKWYA